MEESSKNRWLNFLALLPGTILTLLVISIAFLRFYDERDFAFLRILTNPRAWSNRLTLAALLSALANFGIEWNRRNRETDRLARTEQRRIEEEQRRIEEEQRRIEEEQRRVEEEQRRIAHERTETARRLEEKEQKTRRTRIEIERDIALLTFLVDPSQDNRQKLVQILALLTDYQNSL